MGRGRTSMVGLAARIEMSTSQELEGAGEEALA